MKNVKRMTVRMLSMSMAAAVVVVLTAVPVHADDDMPMKPMPAQSGMPMPMPMEDMGMDMDMPMDMDKPMCCMKMMGSMSAPQMAKGKGMSGMKMTSTLPGFPGSSHLYHIGSTGFFLDHQKHITLTHDQQMALNGIKEKTMAAQSDADRKIQEAEQKMWQLTAVDSPDEAKIEANARQTEKLRGDQRMAFIRAVGEAAKVLTPAQQQALLGTMPADAKKPMAPKMKM